MKKPRPIFLLLNLFLLTGIFISSNGIAQPGYQVKKDPNNPKRNILVMKPRPVPGPRKDILQATVVKPALSFKPFEMKNYRTNKSLDPSAVITIRYPDGNQKKTTVKQLFEQINALELELNKRGRTLRVPHTFSDLKPEFKGKAQYSKPPVLQEGFRTNVFKTGTGKLSPSPGFAIAWNPRLYIAFRRENATQAEFPDSWVIVTDINTSRKIFPILVGVPAGMDKLVTRVDWQVSDKPFDGTLKTGNTNNILRSGSKKTTIWNKAFPGTGAIPNQEKLVFIMAEIDLSTIEAPPAETKKYYLRVLLFDNSNQLMKVSQQVVARYGGKPQGVEQINIPQNNTVPGFHFSFPDAGDLPFGITIKGGLASKKTTMYSGPKNETATISGYKLSFGASISLKHFNFRSLVGEPLSLDQPVIEGRFSATLGKGTGNAGETEAQGIRFQLGLLGQPMETIYDYTLNVPNTPEVINLSYDLPQGIDITLVDQTFMFGPIPLDVYAAITGEMGFKVFGQANIKTKEVSGGFSPFLRTQFNASAGVNAVIAYATINAKVAPLLNVDMPVTFSAAGQPALSFSNYLSGLNGKVYLLVGFLYPCPDVGKIIGFLTGSEEVPFCECKWEYTIFDFNGFNYSTSY